MGNNLVDKNKIKVVALDFDGVITKLNIDWNSAIRLASQIAGYDIISLLTFYETSQGTPIFHLISKEMEKLELQALKNAKPMPFLNEFLEKISKADVEIFLVSMQSASVVEEFLNEHNLAHYFRGVFTREMFPSKKAEVSHILDCLGVKPEEVLLVDDSRTNITQCKELGVKCFRFEARQNSDAVRKMWLAINETVQEKNT
jgi:phosphoglycolate phosphatase-like HAD superfamily hydrolase